MTLLFNYPKKRSNALFIAHATSPDFSHALFSFESIKLLEHSGKTGLNTRFLTASEKPLSIEKIRGLKENKLLSALSGVKAYSNDDGIIVADSSSFSVEDLGLYISENAGKSKTRAPDLPPREKYELARNGHAIFKTASALLKNKVAGTVICHGHESFDAGVRLKRETGVKTVFSLYAHRPEWETSERAAIEHADGLIACEQAILKKIASAHADLIGPTGVRDSTLKLSLALKTLDLAKERAVLGAIAKSPTATAKDRRTAATFVKQAGIQMDLLQATAGDYHLRTQKIALLPLPLTHHAVPNATGGELTAAKRRIASLKTADGKATIDANKLVWAHATNASTLEALLTAASNISPDIGMLIYSETPKPKAIGAVRRKVTFVETASELDMLASDCVVLPEPTPSSVSRALRAIAIGQKIGSNKLPAILTGPAASHGLEQNALLPAKAAGAELSYLIENAVDDPALRERLTNAASIAAQKEWSFESHGRELAAFISGF